MSPERLQKVLASAGIASRRDCEALIAAGRVMVNGRVVVVPGTRVDLDHDEVLVDGQPLQMPTKRTYIMLHKPAGVVSTAEDTHGRPTVLDLVNVPARVFPVGRLDMDSEGLILLTDDGELAYALTHPSFEVEKEYRVLLDRALTPEALRSWRNGVLLDGEMTAPAWVELIGTAPEGVWVRIVLREGRKRQIRAVAKLLGYEVRRLIRVREGDLVLGDLPPRAWRYLTDEEVAALRAHIAKRRPSVERSPGVGSSSVRDRDDERPSNRTPDVRSREERDERSRGVAREPRARRDSGERGREFAREPRARSEERSRSTPSRSGPKSKPPSARSSQQQRSTGREHQRRNERLGRNKEKDQE
ncbi:pseudouridine synthase [Chloroflexus sp.]|uniref:pseudouridine synthase n=1 Tax=Chloroflexus sp. TaxID=1904827 RepID=UPI002ADE7ECB|nr:pseudouridine synthase [Chloroflexus sp.]